MNRAVQKSYRKGAVAVLIDLNDKFLIIQKINYGPKDWTIIGGGRERKETSEENIFREIMEEINVNVHHLEIIGRSKKKLQYEYPEEVAQSVHNGKYIGQSYDQFLIRFKGNSKNIKILPSELRKYKWVDFKELKTYLRFPNQYVNLKEVVEELKPELIDKL